MAGRVEPMSEKLVLGTLLSLFLLSTALNGFGPGAASAQSLPNQSVCVTASSLGDACVVTSDGTAQADNDFVMPTGAVLAFNLGACPTGWTPFTQAAGRAIIGTGIGSGLTPRALGDSGGEERHTMTIAELVPHSHTIQFHKNFELDGQTGDFGPGGGDTETTDSAGGGQPFNVM